MELDLWHRLQLNERMALSEQIYLHLREGIESAELTEGSRLPASRVLAEQLNVSRNTVTVALEQLKAEGYLVSRTGSGVYVAERTALTPRMKRAKASSRPSRLPPLPKRGRVLIKQRLDRGDSSLPFTMGVPDLSAFPINVWSRLVRSNASRSALLGYDSYEGYWPLREAIAEYLQQARRVSCKPEQVFITAGAQQAIALCTAVLMAPGDAVLMENPGYIRARDAFKAAGATLSPIAAGSNGLEVHELPQQSAARILYVTPTHHYPLGGIMPAAERFQLLEWAAREKVWLLEDDYDSEFYFHARPLPALQGMNEGSPVIYMGSFSKTLFPALRMGYLVLPEPLIPAFQQAKSHQSGESSLLEQAVLADFIRDGHFVRHLRRMRKLYFDKWQHTHGLLERELSDVAEPIIESAGMHIAMRIPNCDDVQLSAQMHAAKYGGSSLSRYYLADKSAKKKEQGFVMGFANSAPAQREAGIKCLASLLGVN